jgi:outer membrane lipoprotein SlyB
MRRTIVIIIAILSVGGLAGYAVSQGHNTALLTTAFTIIGGLAGYELGKKTS